MTIIIFWWLQGHGCLFILTLQPITTSDLWKCLNEQTQREEKRWKAKLHWRSLFRTSNREHFSQQSAGLQGDRAVISWQRGAGHVGTTRLTSKAPDLENADCTHTLHVSVSDSSVVFSVALRTHFSYLRSARLSLAHIYSIVKLQGQVLYCRNPRTHLERDRKFWKWKKALSKFESEMSFEVMEIFKERKNFFSFGFFFHVPLTFTLLWFPVFGHFFLHKCFL